MLNGEPIIVAKDKALMTRSHSCGNVTGLSVNEFVALPSNSKISITYDGEESGEGFICLRKL